MGYNWNAFYVYSMIYSWSNFNRYGMKSLHKRLESDNKLPNIHPSRFMKWIDEMEVMDVYYVQSENLTMN